MQFLRHNEIAYGKQTVHGIGPRPIQSSSRNVRPYVCCCMSPPNAIFFGLSLANTGDMTSTMNHVKDEGTQIQTL